MLDVLPLDPERVDRDRELRRPLEAVARGAADAEEDAEALACVEGAVAVELEVARLAPDDEAADGHLRADGDEGHERLGRACGGVDEEVLRGQREDPAERDEHRVGVELEARDAAVREVELRANGLGVAVASAVRDARRDGLIPQEVRAAGSDEDAAAEREALTGRIREVRDAEPDVGELEDPLEADGLARARRVAEVEAAEVEAVGADLEAVRAAGRVRGRVVARADVRAEPDRREGDARGGERDELLAALDRGVVLDAEVRRGHDDDVRDRDVQRGDLDAELAGHAEGGEKP